MTNQKESDTEDLEKHYRVTLDFRLLVRAITTEVCQESFFFNDKSVSADEPYFREHIEKQRRLYSLLRNNRQALEQYLLLVVIQQAILLADKGLADAFDLKDEDELLASLYRGMSEEDARFFKEFREVNALMENTELVWGAFKMEWVGAEVEEISQQVVGDMKRVEIAEQTRMRILNKLSR